MGHCFLGILKKGYLGFLSSASSLEKSQAKSDSSSALGFKFCVVIVHGSSEGFADTINYGLCSEVFFCFYAKFP